MSLNFGEFLMGSDGVAVGGLVLIVVVIVYMLYKLVCYFLPSNLDKKTSQEWYRELHSSDHIIMDPDGWRNVYGGDKALDAFKTELVTREEYMKMHDQSTLAPLSEGSSYFS